MYPFQYTKTSPEIIEFFVGSIAKQRKNYLAKHMLQLAGQSYWGLRG
jgi:hypothetical protein